MRVIVEPLTKFLDAGRNFVANLLLNVQRIIPLDIFLILSQYTLHLAEFAFNDIAQTIELLVNTLKGVDARGKGSAHGTHVAVPQLLRENNLDGLKSARTFGSKNIG